MMQQTFNLTQNLTPYYCVNQRMFLRKIELEGTKKKKSLVVFHFSKALLFLSK